MAVRWAAWGLYLGLYLGLVGCADADSASCVETGTYVDVDTASHRLYLCEGQITQDSYRVRLGVGGTGKSKEGDRKTPLGTYSLGPARASTKSVAH
jgi:hypothetical protein